MDTDKELRPGPIGDGGPLVEVYEDIRGASLSDPDAIPGQSLRQQPRDC